MTNTKYNTIILAGTLAFLITPHYCMASTAPTKRLLQSKITCSDAEFVDTKFGAICNNGDSTINVAGPAICSYTPPTDGQYSQSDNVSTSEDEDLIYCWCRITEPFKSQYVFAYEYLYQAECENWCPNFCAQQITQNAKLRTALFSNITH